MIMEMEKLSVKVSTKTFVKTLCRVLKNVTDQYFSTFCELIHFILVNLNCLNNAELKLSSIERRTNQKSKQIRVVGAKRGNLRVCEFRFISDLQRK